MGSHITHLVASLMFVFLVTVRGLAVITSATLMGTEVGRYFVQSKGPSRVTNGFKRMILFIHLFPVPLARTDLTCLKACVNQVWTS